MPGLIQSGVVTFVMAIQPDEVKGAIALELDTPRLSAPDFINAADAFIGLIRAVSSTKKGTAPPDAWDLSVSGGSQVINVYPNSKKIDAEEAGQIVDSILSGLSQIEEGTENPFGGNYRAIEHVRVLGRMATREEGAVPIRCLSHDQAKVFSKNMYNHASEILSWQHETDGTVDGVLDVVSAHNRLEFHISEFLHGKTVRCLIDEKLIAQALASFRKRVEVVGRVSYAKDGFPKVVKATEIIQFPEKKDIPHFSKLKGILRQSIDE